MYHSSYKYITNLLTKGAYLLFCVECTKADDGKLPDIARRIKRKTHAMFGYSCTVVRKVATTSFLITR